MENNSKTCIGRLLLALLVLFSISLSTNTRAQTPIPSITATPIATHTLEEASQLLEEGRSTLESSPLTEARKTFEACANTGTATFDCCFDLAEVYYYMTFMNEMNNRKDDAKKTLDLGLKWGLKASNINDQSADIHALLADMYVKKILLGDLFTPMDCGPKGGAQKDKAIKLAPNNPRVLAMQGRCFLFAPPLFGGDVHKAVVYFKKSLELDPNSDETYFWLAKAYHNLKDQTNFETAIQAALKLNPKNILAQKEFKSWPLKPAKDGR